MLVLLIIFMVTAPLMTSGVSVDLPKTDAKPLNTDSQPLTVVDRRRRARSSCRTRRCSCPNWSTKLQAIAQNNQDRRIFVRGDKDLAYGRIMEVMGTITQGGFTKVALLAEQPTTPPAAAPPAAPRRGPASTGRPKAGEAGACCNASCAGRTAWTAGPGGVSPRLRRGAIISARDPSGHPARCC